MQRPPLATIAERLSEQFSTCAKAILFQGPSHFHFSIRQNVTMQSEREPGEEQRIKADTIVVLVDGRTRNLPAIRASSGRSSWRRVRTRRPEKAVLCGRKKRERRYASLEAGVQGFEPQLADPESAVLPLNDTPECCVPNSILSLANCQAVFGR